MQYMQNDVVRRATFYFLLGEAEPCCANKTVGNVNYNLESQDLSRTKYYGCKDDCIYRR
jgi:hypothetical protein